MVYIGDNAFLGPDFFHPNDLVYNDYIYYNRPLADWISTIVFSNENANPIRASKKFYTYLASSYVIERSVTLPLKTGTNNEYVLNSYSLYGNY
jgi:hypothetical protein